MYYYLPKLAIGPVSKPQRFSFQRLYTDCLNRTFTRLSFLGGRPFRFGGITRRVELEFKIEHNTTTPLTDYKTTNLRVKTKSRSKHTTIARMAKY